MSVITGIARKIYQRSKNTKFSIDKNTILGRGGFGCVFKGKFRDRDVAIKRVFREEICEMPWIWELVHENVIRFFHKEEDFVFV